MYRYSCIGILYTLCYSYIYIFQPTKKKVRLDLPWFTPSNLWDLLLKDRNFHRLTIYFHRLIQHRPKKRNAGEMPWIFSDEGMASLKSFKTDFVWFGSPCYSDSHSLLIAKKTCHPLVYCGNKKTLQAQMQMNCCLHVQQLILQWGGLFTEIRAFFGCDKLHIPWVSRCPAFLPHWSQMVTVSRCCSQWNLQKIRLITGSPAPSLLKKVTIITIRKENVNVAIPPSPRKISPSSSSSSSTIKIATILAIQISSSSPPNHLLDLVHLVGDDAMTITSGLWLWIYLAGLGQTFTKNDGNSPCDFNG